MGNGRGGAQGDARPNCKQLDIVVEISSVVATFDLGRDVIDCAMGLIHNTPQLLIIPAQLRLA